MTIGKVIQERGITEVLHFTTSNGLIGTLSNGLLLAHSELPKEKSLAYIAQVNCPDRSRDADFHQYVNLSISRINASFFSVARNKWHATKDLYWCILSFDPIIMTHEGVLFSTTNNAYANTLRALGADGLQTLFAPAIRQFPNKWVQRSKSTSAHHTTCAQAEVLYPRGVPIQYLRKVYLPNDDVLAEAEAQLGFCVPQLAQSIQLSVATEQFG